MHWPALVPWIADTHVAIALGRAEQSGLVYLSCIADDAPTRTGPLIAYPTRPATRQGHVVPLRGFTLDADGAPG